MSVGTISLVGVSIVFLSFLVLYIIFRVLEFVFGEKGEKKTALKKVENKDADMKQTSPVKTVFADEVEEDDTELVAVISAAITAYSDKPVRIVSISEDKGHKINWRNHRNKIWRPVRKGVKRTW